MTQQIPLDACKKEADAFFAAWKALPVRGEDPKAEAVAETQDHCGKMLSSERSRRLHMRDTASH